MANIGVSPRALCHLWEPMCRSDSYERLKCPKSGHGVLGVAMCLGMMKLILRFHQECPRVVKLVMGLHHVNQEGNQRKF